MPIVLKSGNLNLLEPSGPVQACNGIAFFAFINMCCKGWHILTVHWCCGNSSIYPRRRSIKFTVPCSAHVTMWWTKVGGMVRNGRSIQCKGAGFEALSSRSGSSNFCNSIHFILTCSHGEWQWWFHYFACLRGTWWRSWLRHCATSRKVKGSVPNSVIGSFHWHNPSNHTVALGLTQPLTEMSTGNISGGVCKADQCVGLTTFMFRMF